MTTEIIWRQFSAQLLQFIQSKVATKAIAEDILQEVFIKIHLHQRNLQKTNRLSSWVYQITRNTIIDYYRRKKWGTTPLSETLPLLDEEKETPPDFTNCLKSFIHQLPPKYKEALLQTTYGQLSQKEYAQQNQLTYSTAKSRVQRGKVKLKELFMECCAVETDVYGNVVAARERKCMC